MLGPGERLDKPGDSSAPIAVPGPGPGNMPGLGERKPMPEALPNEPMEVSGIYVYVPVTFLAATGAKVDAKGEHALIECGGNTIEVAGGNTAALVNGKICNTGKEARLEEGELYIPLNWFPEELLGWSCSVCDGVAYLKMALLLLQKTSAGFSGKF